MVLRGAQLEQRVHLSALALHPLPLVAVLPGRLLAATVDSAGLRLRLPLHLPLQVVGMLSLVHLMQQSPLYQWAAGWQVIMLRHHPALVIAVGQLSMIRLRRHLHPSLCLERQAVERAVKVGHLDLHVGLLQGQATTRAQTMTL